MRRRWWVLGLVAVALGTYALAQLGNDDSEAFLDQPTGRALVQAYGALSSNYLEEVDDEELLQGAIRGMVSALDDRFSSYSEPSTAENLREQREGAYEGIGAVLTPLNRQTGEGVEILQVYEGGPADQAGLQRGDVFLEVDGTDVREYTTAEVAEIVRGPSGSTVDLLMRRPTEDGPIEFAIDRASIEIVDVSGTMLEEDVGYVRIERFFSQETHEQMVDRIAALQEEGATSLVLDLRDNPGGLLNEGIAVADEFLSEGDIVFQRARGVTQRLASADANALELPLVVLVNDNSASASEIVAGALQQNDRAQVVGEETYGKGVGQTAISLADGGQFSYVSFEWLTPDRTSIAEEGIQPDVRAEDDRFPNVVSVEGQGAEPGAEVEIVVDGETVGSAQAGEDGTFEVFSTTEPPQVSANQAQAQVSLEDDNALRVALETLREEIQAQR